MLRFDLGLDLADGDEWFDAVRALGLGTQAVCRSGSRLLARVPHSELDPFTQGSDSSRPIDGRSGPCRGVLDGRY